MTEKAEKILDQHYKPKMHWKLVNRKNVLKAMEEYANRPDVMRIAFEAGKVFGMAEDRYLGHDELDFDEWYKKHFA